MCTAYVKEGCVCSKQGEIELADPSLFLWDKKGSSENEKVLGL